jgi:hypothetical protein
MEYVICDEVSEGLRPGEATVAVRSLKGKREFLRVSEKGLRRDNGRQYLAIGVVYQDPDSRAYLIEFPHEADSGANRIWVPEANVLQDRSRVPA